MAFNNGFPMNYPQYYYTQPQVAQVQQPQIQQAGQSNNFQNGTSSIIWVQGEAGAKSYLVAPNTTVQLWDSEEQVIYLKSADASGMPSMKILDYKIREANPQAVAPVVISQPEMGEYVTKDELQAFESKIQKQIEKLDIRPRKETNEDE